MPVFAAHSQKVDVILAREPLKVGVVKDQRLVHHAVDHQAVVVFLQLNRSGVVTLKRTALRRDRAV